jgi:5'-3' exonuclease
MGKKSLSNLFKEYESDIETKPISRKPDEHIFISDGLNTFIRAFAVNPSMNEDGSHIGGIVGFLKSIRFGVNKFKPTRCVIVFDGKNGSKKRRKLYPQYKMNRGSGSRLNRRVDWTMTPTDESESMRIQLVRLVEYLEHLPITILSVDGVEADDVIGYLTNTTLKDSKCTIMSTDKDFLQLVSDRVELYSPTKKITYDEELVKKEFGIYPQNMLTCRTVEGDKSDNIHGIRGIGAKTMIKEYPMLSENQKFDVKMLIDSASTKSTRISNMIKDGEMIVKRNYILMQLYDPDIPNHTKLKITDAIREHKPKIVKYKLQRLMVEDKLWGHIPNFDNWITEFMLLQHYWNNK